MSASAFQVGATVELDCRQYTLLRKISKSTWQLEELRTKRISEYQDNELRQLYAEGRLIFASCRKPMATDASQEEAGIQHVELSPADWELAKVRRAYVQAVINLPNTKSALHSAIQEVWDKLHEPTEPPSPISVYRWKKRYVEAGRDIRSLAPRHSNSGNRQKRYPPEVEEAVENAIARKYLTGERGKIQDALDSAKATILKENRLRPSALQLPQPTRRLVKRMITEVPAFDRYAARHGRMAATKRFRSVQKHRTTEAPLERAEIDHTPLDLMVIDDYTGLPLGRPYLTVCIDDYTRCALGLHISFEPPSYLTVARCLKHAFLPKIDIQAKYPSIQNEWAAHGVMRELVVDNGAEFHSNSLENACFTLGIEMHYSARKTPWFKGKIERFQGTLNRAIAHGNPGTTFSNIFEKEEYDPSKHAIIRLSILKEITHKWIVDVYHQKPHRTLQAPPVVVWHNSISPDDILLPNNPAELDAIMGRTEERRLTHKGIELYGLQYNSPELTALRRQLGDILDVSLRVDDADLGEIIVFSPDKKRMFKVPSITPEYAKGLSAWQHRVCKKYAAKSLEKFNPAGWLEAKAAIARLIDEELMHKKQRSRTKIARYKDNALPPTVHSDVALSAPQAASKAHSPSLQLDAQQATSEPEPLIPADVSPPEATRPAKQFKPVRRQRNPQALESEHFELPGDQA
jgi:putative transposase